MALSTSGEAPASYNLIPSLYSRLEIGNEVTQRHGMALSTSGGAPASCNIIFPVSIPDRRLGIKSRKDVVWRTYVPLGRVFHAMVSVMAVKIQFSSPRGVLRSFSLPGTLGGGGERKGREMIVQNTLMMQGWLSYFSATSGVTPLTRPSLPDFFWLNLQCGNNGLLSVSVYEGGGGGGGGNV